MKRKVRVWAFFLAQHISAVTQLRFIGPFGYLPGDEFEFVYAPSWKAALRLLSIPRIIVFHRNICPFREINRIIRFARSHGIATILDMDDLLTQVPASHPSYAHYQKIKLSLIEVLKAVDIVTVTNVRLKEYYQRYNPRVYVLSNFLDERIWNNKYLKREKDGTKIIIGYAGSPTHADDFKAVTPAIRYILSKYNGQVGFRFIGFMPPELEAVSGLEHIPELTSYYDYAKTLINSNFDFAIAPLEDNAFNQCKSNIKFLEYSICGYAGIYSAVGPYLDSIVPDETGLLVKNTTDKWISAMELLINNPERRQTLAGKAFQQVRRVYSSKEKSKAWYQLYSEIAVSPSSKNSKKRSFGLLAYGCFFVYLQLINIYYKILNIGLKIFSRGARIG